MGFDSTQSKEFRALLLICSLLATEDIEVVRLGGYKPLDVYGEYAPYKFSTREEMINACQTGVVNIK